MATKSGAGGLVYSVVAIAIIVLIVSTVAVPVIEDSSETIRTVDQNTAQRYSIVSSTAALTVDSSSNVVQIGDYTMPTGTGVGIVAITDSFILRHYDVGHPELMYVDDGVNDLFSQSTSFVVFDGTKMTYTSSGVERTCNYSWLLIASDSGDYGFFSGVAFNFNKDSVIYTVYWNNVTNSDLSPTSARCMAVLAGKMGEFKSVFCTTDTVDVTFAGNNAGSVNITSFSEGDGYYTMPISPRATLTVQSSSPAGDYSIVNSSWTVFIAPIEYTYISDNDYAAINLLDVLPILLFLVPVMFAVRMIQTRRN